MRLLLDTQLILWRMTGAKIPAAALALMDDPQNSEHVSAVSVWEVAIKWAIRRGRPDDMPMSGTAFLGELGAAGVWPMPVTGQHGATLDQLPLHHRDPFDRLLVATARSESMHLLTSDTELAAYGDFVIAV